MQKGELFLLLYNSRITSHCQAVTISVLSTIRLNVGQSMTTLMDSSADADAFCSAWWLVMGTSNRRVRCSPGSSSLPLSQFLSFCSALFPLLSFTVSVCLWYCHATMLIGQQQQQQMNKMSDCVLLAANGLFTTTLSLASLSPVVAKRRDFFAPNHSSQLTRVSMVGKEMWTYTHWKERVIIHRLLLIISFCVSRQSGTVLLSAEGAGAADRGCRCICCNCGGGGPFLVVPHCLFSH